MMKKSVWELGALLLLVVFVALALTACGDENSVSVNSETATNTTPATGQSAASFTVTFDTQGGSEIPAQTVAAGQKIEKPVDPEKTGYTFGGWTCAGEDWSFIGYIITEDMTLTAEWTPNTYTVSFDANGGNAPSPLTVTYDAAYSLPAATRAGYSLAGWYDGETKIEDGTWQITSGKALTARWTVNTYTVSYNVNGGKAIANPATYQITDDVTLAAPTWEYRRFLGWYKASGEKVTNLQGHTGDLSLTAEWECYFTLSGNTITGVSAYFKNNMTVIAIPSSLNGTPITGIAANAFANCTRLTSVTVPDSVTSIGAGAFKGCSSLASITIPFVGESIKTASQTCQYPFGYIFGTSSYTGGVATKQYYYGYSTSSLTNTTYYIPASLRSVTVTGGIILYGAFRNCSGLTSVTIPDGVTSIGNYAFSGCSRLASINIPDSVATIGNYAFSGCSGLISITIPDSVTRIEQYAFYGCSKLTSITIPGSVTRILDFAFSGCTGLTSVYYTGDVVGWCRIEFSSFDANPLCYAHDLYINGKLVTELVIPNSVTRIGWHAFEGCTGLMTVTIPNSITSIGNYALQNCTGLTSITYQGTKAEWNAISKGTYWNNDTGNFIIHCTDGDIAK